MAQTSMTIRIDSKQKALFDSLCEQFGMSANAAINVFVKASLDEINAEIKEVRRLRKERNGVRSY